MTSPALSVLDLVPVRSDQTTGDALAATRRLAQVADELGFTRYWLAEHHNMPAVAATNPPVLIAMVAAATERIRVGSGGVMLPNHAPLVVAEQFALLEAAYPGRIDLGIGRAPGTDPVTSYALRHGAGGVTDDAVEQFPAYVDNIVTMMSPGGAGLQVNGRMHPLNATPHATSVADGVAARLLGLLGPARGRQGPPLRLRPPLLRARDRRGARALPLVLPPVRGPPGAADLPDRQRRRRADDARRPCGWLSPTCCRWSTSGPAVSSPRSRSSRRPRPAASPRSTVRSPTRCSSAGSSVRRTRPPSRWPSSARRTTSTR